jgi:hypothetical protein
MGFDTEKSSVVMMFYRNTAIITVVGMLLLIGMGPREKLIPNSLVQALSTPVKSNNSKGTAPAKAANATANVPKPNATATAAATAAATAKPNSTAAATGTAVAK